MTRPSSVRAEDGAAIAPSAASVAPALDLDELMGRLREEVQARKRRAAPEADAPASFVAPKPVRAGELLELPEAAFVMTAYRLLLRREAEPEEADRQIDRLLLGRVRRTEMLAELQATPEARAAGSTLEGLPQARLREALMASRAASLCLSAANGLRTVYLLPRRIRQFVKRVEALEQRASESARRIEVLEQEALSLRAAVEGEAAEAPAEPPAAAVSARRRSNAR